MATRKRVSGDFTIETLNPADSITLDSPFTTVTGDLTVVGNAVLTGNINADRIFNGSSNVEIAAPGANVTVSVNGTNNVLDIGAVGAVVSGVAFVTGNITGANVNTGGIVTATGNVIGANINTAGNVWISRDASAGQPTIRFIDTDTDIADGQTFGALEWFTNDVSGAGARVTSAIRSRAAGLLGNANIEILTSTNGAAPTVKVVILSTGNVGVGNVAPVDLFSLGGTMYVSSTATVIGNITGGNLLTAGSATATGNIQGGNITTAGLVTATGNVTAGNVISVGAVSAGAGGLSATGNVDGGNLRTSGIISATGNLTTTDIFGTTVSVSGNITGGNIAVASAGTVGSLTVNTLLTGGGTGVENTIYQSADVDISSVTPVTMGSLQFSAIANNAYKFQAYIPFAPDGAMTIAPAVNFSSGSCIYTTEIQPTSTSQMEVVTKTTSDDVAVTYASTGTDVHTLRVTGWFYHTANVTVSMTMQNSTGNVTVKNGGWLSYTRIA
jgi:hypothetical protein